MSLYTDAWTPARKRKLIRDKKGRFKLWRGGKTKADVTTKRLNYRAQGIRVHIGKQFADQHGRRPKIGDTVRTKTSSGAYHAGAEWYVYTRFGWRNANTKGTLTSARIKQICDNARPSRSRR